jgi:zinc protease
MLPPPGAPREINYFAIWIRPVQIAKQLKAQYPELSDIKIGHAHFAIRMAIRELDKLVTDGMTKKAFEETRQFLQSYIKLYVQRPSDRLGYLMDSWFYGRKDYIDEMENLLAKLTVEDVNNAIKKYWQVKNMDITIVTDISEAEPLAKNLQENLASPMSYSNLVKNGQPKDVLEEDDVVANYKLNINSVKIVKNEDTFK